MDVDALGSGGSRDATTIEGEPRCLLGVCLTVYLENACGHAQQVLQSVKGVDFTQASLLDVPTGNLADISGPLSGASATYFD